MSWKRPAAGADNMRRQIKDYLEDAASAKMAAEELRRENAALRKKGGRPAPPFPDERSLMEQTVLQLPGDPGPRRQC